MPARGSRRSRAEAPRGGASPSLSSVACGLLVTAVVALPAVFNPRGEDAFGVTKAILLQVLGLLAGACAGLAVWSEGRRLHRSAVLIAAAAVVVTCLAAALFGVAPLLSFFAASARHEGTLTMLALAGVTCAAAILEREEIDVVLGAIVIGSVGPCVYAIVARIAEVPELGWSAFAVRAGGSFGNPILLGDYLVMVLPMTAMRARARDARLWIVVALQIVTLAATRARGAWIAVTVAAVILVALRVKGSSDISRRSVAAGIAAVLVVAVAGITLAVSRFGIAAFGPTVHVRAIIWHDVLQLIAASRWRLILGYGPGLLQSLVTPFYSPELTLVEGAFSVPDRAHNEILDAMVAAGIVGAAALVTLHLLLWRSLLTLRRGGSTDAGSRQRTRQITGVFAGVIAHFVSIQVGVASLVSLLIWWCSIGLAAAWAKESARIDVTGAPVQSRPAAGIAAAAVAVAAMAFGLSGANLGAHEATLLIAFFVVASVIVAMFIATTSGGTVHRCGAALVCATAIAIVLTATVPDAAAADILAGDASRDEQAGRWTEAVALQEARVRLTPVSDVAWGALGRAELELARRTDASARTAHFERARAAVAEARRLNPLDWFAIRNAASIERVWAAADPDRRPMHLEAADRAFREASARAPTHPRLWAEWGNVDAERGNFHDAFVKLERAATLYGGTDAKVVTDAILRASGADLNHTASVTRAGQELRRLGFPTLASLYEASGNRW
jgi:O-antigen ligase/tetratricopeptide (TPR) repeat protein